MDVVNVSIVIIVNGIVFLVMVSIEMVSYIRF